MTSRSDWNGAESKSLAVRWIGSSRVRWMAPVGRPASAGSSDWDCRLMIRLGRVVVRLGGLGLSVVVVVGVLVVWLAAWNGGITTSSARSSSASISTSWVWSGLLGTSSWSSRSTSGAGLVGPWLTTGSSGVSGSMAGSSARSSRWGSLSCGSPGHLKSEIIVVG